MKDQIDFSFKSEHDRYREEFCSKQFKDMLRDKLGTTCGCCGTDKNIEYHHIVHLENGGNNRITNIAPLCYSCHNKAHSKCVYKSRDYLGGRPKAKPIDGYEDVLEDYLNGSIGKKECSEILGVPGKTKLNDLWYYKDYLQSNGVVSHKNSIDILKSKNNFGGKKQKVAEIVYEDRTEIVFRTKLGGYETKTIKK